MNEQPLDGEEIRLLTELGFVAAGAGRLDWAEDIFHALMLLRPQRAFPHIGLALAYMNAARSQEAVALLERARVSVDEGQDGAALADVEAFRGLALQLAGRSAESRRALQWAADRNQTSDGGRLAARLLGLELVE